MRLASLSVLLTMFFLIGIELLAWFLSNRFGQTQLFTADPVPVQYCVPQGSFPSPRRIH